ncbi:serine hydrolase [Mucilaginibacter sp.]|uniref:serine hydrolase domain-containing protein n=1 Tax=Mucilaginibacter sp. TaxID=1882438 RepID=UPI00261CFC82|nr:serine hydrolase domain-containing protein [Mucilaginibacter sp.]MDB4926073.1 beta-lactamase family protein [Mucilaginibacter sp.]
MKPIRSLVFIVFGIFASLNMSAQSLRLQKTDSVLTLVKKHFKSKDADGIYALTGANFRKALSMAAFRDICSQQLFPLGEIKKDSLLSFVNNKTATYKLQFDAVTMQLLMNLDQDDKIELFLFQPYKDESATKPEPVATSNPLKSDIDKKINAEARKYIQKANTVGLSIGIIKDGKVSTYNYGETTRGNKRLPTTNTIFEIGSITKTFTSTLLAYYVNEGKISLTDPITKFLPDSVARNPELKNITLLNLSNHTSGLPSLPDNFSAQRPYNKINPYKNYNKQLLFAYLKKCTLNSRPGEQYAYSNLAAGLLGTILEQAGGKGFEQLVWEIICSPLQMKSTVQHLTPMISTRFATVYDDNGQQTPAWDFDALAPAGSLRSTVNDLLLYAKANMTKSDSKLSKAFELTHQITFNTDTKLGLAWHIIEVNGVSYYFHNGGTYGSSSFLAYNIEKNIAVIILSNASPGTDVLGVSILKQLQ